MRIPLDQIHESGMEITAGPADRWVQEAAKSVRGTPGEPTQDPHEDEGAETATVNLTLVRRMDRVEVSGDLEMRLRCACDRCGECVNLTISGDIDRSTHRPSQTATTRPTTTWCRVRRTWAGTMVGPWTWSCPAEALALIGPIACAAKMRGSSG